MLIFGSSHELHSSSPSRRVQAPTFELLPMPDLAKDRNPLSPSPFLSGIVGPLVPCHFACISVLPTHPTLHATVTLVSDRSSFVHRLSAVGESLLPAGMESVAREQQHCPPGVHRVRSPKRYASEDSEGRPAALLSYQFQSRVNRMFPLALTEAGLCAICFSKEDGIVWCPSGPVSCTSCGYEYSNPFEQDPSVMPDNSEEHRCSFE